MQYFLLESLRVFFQVLLLVEIFLLNLRLSDLICVQFKGFESGCIFAVQKVFEVFSYLLSLCFSGST